jgi:sterol desaturase/sphingolipid hydroxylase (fatty acid hydroxylase superfamily)
MVIVLLQTTMTSLVLSDSVSAFCQAAMEHVLPGVTISLSTFVFTILLELCSIETVKKVWKQPGAGSSLYKAAIAANLRNHFILGWPIYTIAATLFCRKKADLDALDRVACVFIILFVHSVLFYSAHRAFHSSPEYYQHHRFHHRFNVHVPPMTANAVSSIEYIVAYILPFTVAMPFVRPDPLSLQASVAIVSFTNLLIHTPMLDELSDKYVPEWLVSTHDHLVHHRKLNTKYAAPTFNIDYFVECLESASGWTELGKGKVT